MLRILSAYGVLALLAAGGPQGTPGPRVPVAEVSLRARAFRPGEAVLVTVVPANREARVVHVRAFDRDVEAHRVEGSTWQAILGIDLAQKPGVYDLVATVDGQSQAAKTMTVAPRQFAVRRLRVNPDFVDPPPAVQARLDEEAAFLAHVYAHSAPAPHWGMGFVRPVPHPANSRFGTRSVFNGRLRSPHAGTDFLSPAGTPVQAPGAGRVAAARELYFSGGTVILDHGAGLFSQLAHLSRIDVREGEHVDAGQVVGRVGATGRVTGPHLHWAVRAAGARVDALSLLAVLAARPGPGR